MKLLFQSIQNSFISNFSTKPQKSARPVAHRLAMCTQSIHKWRIKMACVKCCFTFSRSLPWLLSSSLAHSFACSFVSKWFDVVVPPLTSIVFSPSLAGSVFVSFGCMKELTKLQSAIIVSGIRLWARMRLFAIFEIIFIRKCATASSLDPQP